jgi:hypothetical protein
MKEERPYKSRNESNLNKLQDNCFFFPTHSIRGFGRGETKRMKRRILAYTSKDANNYTKSFKRIKFDLGIYDLAGNAEVELLNPLHPIPFLVFALSFRHKSLLR